ncbi:hypothetical protein [Halalkalibacterium halodurans]|uniref:Uncharacterized protein n=1 Tax=Halalkalibacterium halodurans TaxID=86665 RepID=A0A0M0KI42_ALKHA|nr:hypothetical protein [Halalkalibacterium halodurans]TPE65928.1 hypothetical protein AMD02_019890 [Halalkalibacterium halodurans]
MTEDELIQQLYGQIDRLVTMQNTMLSVVGALFAIIIGVFAFFQWRINHKDQNVIIKTAKEEIIETLIKNYNLLDINENRDMLKKVIDWNNHRFNGFDEQLNDLKKENIELSRDLRLNEISLDHYISIQSWILLYMEQGQKIANEKRDNILEKIIEFSKGNSKRKYMADFLFQLLMACSEEKVSKEEFEMSLK